MKKIILLLLVTIMLAVFAGCSKDDSYEISIRIPAGSTEMFVYADEEIRPSKDKIVITAVEGVSDTEIPLKPVKSNLDLGYKPTYLTMGISTELFVEKGGGYQIGVNHQNISGKELIVKLKIENVSEVRIEEKEIEPIQLSVIYQDDQLAFMIKNNTDKMLGIYDASIRLEKMIDQEWSVVPFAEGVGFCGNASSFDENGTYGPLNFESLYDAIDAGEYRLSLIVSDDISIRDAKDSARVYTTFVVSE